MYNNNPKHQGTNYNEIQVMIITGMFIDNGKTRGNSLFLAPVYQQDCTKMFQLKLNERFVCLI